MFEIGELIMYGTNGVCRVEGFTRSPFNADDEREYYILKPIHDQSNLVIYTPVENENVVMRPLLSLEKAKAFIEWWGSPETMAAYANEFAQAPAHPDAIALCSDEVKAEAEMFTAQEIDWEVCARHMDDWFVKIELEIMP